MDYLCHLVSKRRTKNVYPIKTPSIAKKIIYIYEEFNKLRKYENRDIPKSEEWLKKADDFNKKMTENAFDIRTNNKVYQSKLEALHKVKMTKEDELYYQDNCKGQYKAICSDTISSKWRKSMQRAEKRAESESNKRYELEKAKEDEAMFKKLQVE